MRKLSLAIIPLCLLLVGWIHGNPLGPTSQRAVINMNGAETEDFAFINGFQQGRNWPSPFGTVWNTTTQPWNSSILDQYGFPCSHSSLAANCVGVNPSNDANAPFGGGNYMPSSTAYGGDSSHAYCLDGYGDGTIEFKVAGVTYTMLADGTATCAPGTYNASTGKITLTGSAGSCTKGDGSVTQTSTVGTGNQFAVVADSTTHYWCLAFYTTGFAGGISNGTSVNHTDPSNLGNGHFITGLAIYRTGDAADRAAGNLFRAAWKQEMVNLNPGVVRVMNWNRGQSNALVRAENRPLPTGGWGGYFGFSPCSFLPYGQTSGTDQYTLAGVSNVTNCSTQTSTPASPVHGEVVYARIGNTSTQAPCTGGACPSITHIDNCSLTPQVDCGIGFQTTAFTEITTTTSISALTVNEWVQIYASPGSTSNPTCQLNNACIAGAGVPNLHLYPVQVQSIIDSTHFVVNFNLGSATFVQGSCAATGGCYVTPYECLNVNSRGTGPANCYPITQADGVSPITYFQATKLNAGAYNVFVFNQDNTFQTDGSGNPVMGVWLNWGTDVIPFGVPMEIQVKLLNEINALATSQGKGPSHMWINLPQWGLTSYDTTPPNLNYSVASDPYLQLYNIALNGSTVNGVAYAGLCSQCKLYVEYSNETWNINVFDSWNAQQAWLRWGFIFSGDKQSYSTLKTIWMQQDISNSAYFNRSRTRFVDGLQCCGAYGDGSMTRIYGRYWTNFDTGNPLHKGITFTGTISNGGKTLTATGASGKLLPGYTIDTPTHPENAIQAGSVITADQGGGVYSVCNTQSTICTSVGSGTNIAMVANQSPFTILDTLAVAPYLDLDSTFQYPPIQAICAGNPTIIQHAQTYQSGAVSNLFVTGQSTEVRRVTAAGLSTTLNNTSGSQNLFTITATGATCNGSTNTVSLDVDTSGSSSCLTATACGGCPTCSQLNYGVTMAKQYNADTGNATAQAADVQLFVNGLIYGTTPVGALNMQSLTTGIQSQSAVVSQFNAMKIWNTKSTSSYEGGIYTNPTTQSGAADTASQILFANYVLAVYQGTQLATAQVNFFKSFSSDPNVELPALYIQVGCNGILNGVSYPEWSYACPDTYNGTSTEGSLWPTWGAVGTYDANLP